MNYMRRSFYPSPPPTATNVRSPINVSPSSTTIPLNSAVRFNDSTSTPKKINEREKYLTAKYPQQQMQLIRKRLKVEFWLDDQLKFLYNIKDDSSQEEHDQCPEDLIDSLLDINNDSQRRTFLLEKLRNAKQSRSITMNFIDELLYRIKIL